MGWFGSIEEIENAAKILDMEVKDFCKEFLIREWWSGEDDIEVPAPRKDFSRRKVDTLLFENDIVRNGKGFVRASWGHNLIIDIPCIFLDEKNECKIHQSKPLECKTCFGCKHTDFKRTQLLPYWKEHQNWIIEMGGTQ